MVNPNKITMLDDAFSSYLMDKNDEDFCNKASAILSAFDQSKTFRVSIIEASSKNKEPFFGMRIFPDRQFAEGLLQDMVNGEKATIKEMCTRWQEIPIWEIEIDRRVFDQQAISFNPQELTAMTLHEIGHTTYSDKKIEVFYRVYKEAQIRLKTTEKAATRLLYMLYLIPLTLACGFKDWKIDEGDLRQEVFADQSVKKLGYGDYLISAYKKIIKAYGSGGYVNGASEENIVSRSIDFCNLNIVDLIHRKNKLKDELYRTGTSHSSNYIRKMISYLMSKLEIAQKRKYDGNIVLEFAMPTDFDDPNFLRDTEFIYYPQGFNKLMNHINMATNLAKAEIANEAFRRKNKEIEIPNQLDVDTIFVEVDRIQNHADRRYVLDLIYNQEEKINHFLELCEINDSLKSKHYSHMQSMLRELEEMRKAVLAKRSFDKKYKVFVQYPAGYEG